MSPQSGVCTRPTQRDDVFMASCPQCHHSSLVHGGDFTSPGLDHCLICGLLAQEASWDQAIKQVLATLEELRR